MLFYSIQCRWDTAETYNFKLDFASRSNFAAKFIRDIFLVTYELEILLQIQVVIFRP